MPENVLTGAAAEDNANNKIKETEYQIGLYEQLIKKSSDKTIIDQATSDLSNSRKLLEKAKGELEFIQRQQKKSIDSVRGENDKKRKRTTAAAA